VEFNVFSFFFMSFLQRVLKVLSEFFEEFMNSSDGIFVGEKILVGCHLGKSSDDWGEALSSSNSDSMLE
jgi:hypothetical protein